MIIDVKDILEILVENKVKIAILEKQMDDLKRIVVNQDFASERLSRTQRKEKK